MWKFRMKKIVQDKLDERIFRFDEDFLQCLKTMFDLKSELEWGFLLTMNEEMSYGVHLQILIIEKFLKKKIRSEKEISLPIILQFGHFSSMIEQFEFGKEKKNFRIIRMFGQMFVS